MSVEINIAAHWNPSAKRMEVSMVAKGHRFVEAFTAHQWRKFIYEMNHGGRLRVGGYTLSLKGKASKSWSVAVGIREYLNKVAATFEKTGQTMWMIP